MHVECILISIIPVIHSCEFFAKKNTLFFKFCGYANSAQKTLEFRVCRMLMRRPT